MTGLTRAELLARAGAGAGLLALGAPARAAARPDPGIELAAYYFSQFHPDPRNDGWHGKGWTEWEIVKRAEARFAGHRQPNLPLWGFEDESDPRVMERKIDAAADHGLSAFIFDWYWYENRPFLSGALDRGFLQARNNARLKFALMWANHDWWDLYPATRSLPLQTLLDGASATAPDSFRAATDWIHHEYDALTELATPYRKVRELATAHWLRFEQELPVPYLPNVSMGWDPSPRTAQSDVYENLGYPFTPVLVDNSPDEFRTALEALRAFLKSRTDGPRVATVNAWNEWPEGSYLEPGRRHGLAYLEAVRGVFGR